MRRINIKICAVILAAFLFTAGMLFVCAERGAWTDIGNFDSAWLGNYDETSAYTVSDKAQLAAFAAAGKQGYTFDGKTVTLCSNIDMSEHYWDAAFSSEKKFAGTFDGAGYIIWGLKLSDGEQGAFILNNAGTVKNVSINIASADKASAGIALYNSGNILNCSVIGALGKAEASLVGGISAENSGKIDNCASFSELKSASAQDGGYVGGICAKNTGTVSNCIWSGADNDVADGVPAISGTKYTKADEAIAALNTVAASSGYIEWVSDSTNLFDGYPIMKNASPASVPMQGIRFDLREANLKVDEKIKLSVTFYPENASNKAIVWISTNESVATVDEEGNVTTHKLGYATIRATTLDGGKEANCYIRVLKGSQIVPSESIKLNKTEFDLLLGQSAQIIASVQPANASNKRVRYEVADERVVTCDKNGKLTPKDPGSTIVMITTVDGYNARAAVVNVLEDTYSETWNGKVASKFAGGDGTEQNPYLIETPAQLAKIAADVNAGNSYEGCFFKQKISLRLNDTSFTDWLDRLSYINDWTPIGIDSSHAFMGNYDGGGFSIAGIHIENTSAAAGLFGYTKGGVIENVNVKHSYIKAGEFAGGVVGYNGARIVSCFSSASVSGASYVGGIAGYSSSVVDVCKNSGIISGENYVGGIAGFSDAVILNSSNSGTVSGNDCLGGICGKSTAAIENCYNDAAVRGNTKCGGIVGETSMDTANCHCLIMADGINNVGAIAGWSSKAPSSYIPSNLTAAGNLKNADEFILKLGIDGTYTVKATNKPYIETMNLFVGCIYSDVYLEWTQTDYNIYPGSTMKTLTNTEDENTKTELSGMEILNGAYTFDKVAGEQLVAAISKINSSDMFEKTKLESEHILFACNIKLNTEGVANTVQKTSYRLTVPVDYTVIKDYVTLGEIESFAHVAYINITDTGMLIYIPENIKRMAEGEYHGGMKCISYFFNENSVILSGELPSKSSFYYNGGLMSFAVQSTGEWIVAELGDNEFIVPIETDTSEITTTPPVDTEEKEFDFNALIIAVVCVLLLVGAAAVILIQRSKNNYKMMQGYSSDDEDEN